MPRDAAGNYSLATDPVVGNTPVEAAWANPTLADVAQGLTDSLDRDGNGTMNVGLQYADGSRNAPGISWSNEPNTGFRRAAQFDQRAVVGGNDVARHVRPTEVAGLQHPHEIYDGMSFRPTLTGSGGAKEAPTFGALNCDNLTVGGNVAWGGGIFDGPKVLNNRELYAWGHVVGATATLSNSRNVLGVNRISAGFYQIILSEPMIYAGSFPIVLLGAELGGGAWIEASEDTGSNVRFIVFTGNAPGGPGNTFDADFSFILFNNREDPPAPDL